MGATIDFMNFNENLEVKRVALLSSMSFIKIIQPQEYALDHPVVIKCSGHSWGN
jgi:hypothetical protein